MSGQPEFDLEIDANDTGYTIRVQAAFGVGDLPPQPFVLPIDLATLPRVRRDVADWVGQARITRLSGSPEMRQARTFGTLLFEHLFADEVLACFRQSRGNIPAGQRLRLRLRMPASLIQLPWELLYDPRNEQFLALAPDLALVHYPAMPVSAQPLAVDGPLQVVAVLASPSGDYPPINLDRELRRIEAALKGPLDQGRMALEVIRGPGTLDQLRARLRRPVHVLHVLCHGELDTASGEGVLIFEDTDGAAEPVNAELLRLQLQKQRGQTRLVLLNSCLGALPAGDDPFSSVGASLLHGGVSAVIAMQFELAEDAAAELARVFYAELAAGTPIDLALTEARLHLYGRYPTRLDWAIPVLFMRSEDGTLFQIAQASSQGTGVTGQEQVGRKPGSAVPATAGAPVDSAALQSLWRRALTAFFTKDWEQAEALMAQVAAADASYEDVQEKLAECRRQRRLQVLYHQTRELRDAGQWQATLGALDDLERQQPGYPDTEGLRAWAEGQRQRQQRYDAALAACDRADWAAAVAELEALLAQLPDDAEARALLGRAQAEQVAQTTTAKRARPNGSVALGLPVNRWWLLVPALLLIGFFAWNILANRPSANTPLDATPVATSTGELPTSVPIVAGPTPEQPTSSSSPADDSLSGRLAFVSRAGSDEPFEIYTVGIDGKRQCVTCGLGKQVDKVHPSWSPDGQHIVFVARFDRAEQDLYAINIDGSGLERLTNNGKNELPGDNSDPSWSRDGEKIVFVSDQGNGTKYLHIMNADGSEEVTLQNDGKPIAGCNPAWSPSGERIAFVLTCDLSSERADIYVVNSDGSGLSALVENGARNYGPAWSPDEQWIAFYSDLEGDWNIFVVDVTGKTPIALTNNSSSNQYPSWSPNGAYIAFYSNRDGNNEIYVMRTKDPSNPRNITDSADHDDNNPAWSSQ